MGGEVKLDRWGYQVLSYGRERSVILEASAHDPNCVLANILTAQFLCSSNPSRAPPHLEAAKAKLQQATAYEKAVFDAVSCLISPDRDDDVAYELLSKLLKDFPRDLVSLKKAQVLCFYMGQPDLSLDIVQQVLPKNEEEDYIYGMLAFPLLELGQMEDAAKAAKKGFEINKEDCWAQHGLCHVLQYECCFKEAVDFMEERSKSWSSLSSFMYTHNWWHVALCYLEGNAPMRKVLEVYDHCIWKELERSDAVSAEVYLNALGLLLRVYVRGEIDIFGDRLKILAARLTDQLAEALFEYGKGNYNEALELLGPDFDANNCKTIGASDEQLDVFNEVWYVMMLNTGQVTKGERLFHVREARSYYCSREGQVLGDCILQIKWSEQVLGMLGPPLAFSTVVERLNVDYH
ncbi:tetratricopeptide repeat (TPR)-like superfamily protein [Actinidia rufa]|uniref:Tetratricopeptide repeat protein 38 n=1 Tax=Actinidia rufa TaxID=165716 RepID=A0A7J0HEP1_9ERIC|nr:tetratricopeptide repeat (TPR)-like superfamily protein [Actinidia rufa]